MKQLLHMLKDVEEEFYENKKIDHDIEWEQEGKVFLYLLSNYFNRDKLYN